MKPRHGNAFQRRLINDFNPPSNNRRRALKRQAARARIVHELLIISRSP